MDKVTSLCVESQITDRFQFLQTDGHWYLIPVTHVEEFYQWCEWSEDYWDGEGDYEDKEDWKGTDFDRYMIGGHPSLYTFSFPMPANHAALPNYWIDRAKESLKEVEL